jgi:hypothetical protein
MALKTLLQSLLLPALFSIASCVSSIEDSMARNPDLASDTARPVVRFFGPDFVPPQHGHSTQSTFVKPITALEEPIEHVEALDTIKSILAQHGLSVKLGHVEAVSSVGKTHPEQHAFAVTTNQQDDQQSILHSFAENQTVIITPPKTSDSDDVPWFGDGFCCFEGCPPGSCPSIYVSTNTGNILTVAQADTIACRCRGHGYCCCAGCPAGTCGAGSCQFP